MAQKLEQLLSEQPSSDARAAGAEPAAAPPAHEPESLRPDEPVVPEPRSELHQQMELLRDQLEMAFDEVVTRISRVEKRLSSSVLMELEERSAVMVALLQQLLDRVEEAPSPPNDLSAQIEENRIRLEGRFDTLHDQIRLLREVPPTIDVSPLEDVADRGALRNAAEIATVRQGVDSLSDLVRHQEKSLSELRSTLEWIKERLLLR